MDNEQLVSRFLPMIRRLSKKLAYGGVSSDDLESEAVMAVLGRIDRYDPARGELKQWVYWTAFRAIHQFSNREQQFYRRWKSSALDGLPDTLPEDWSDFLDRLNSLPRCDSELLCQYFGIGTLKKDSQSLGREFGISPSAVRMRVKSILATLRGNLTISDYF